MSSAIHSEAAALSTRSSTCMGVKLRKQASVVLTHGTGVINNDNFSLNCLQNLQS